MNHFLNLTLKECYTLCKIKRCKYLNIINMLISDQGPSHVLILLLCDR